MRALSPLPVLALFALLAPAALAAGDQVTIGLQQEPTTLDPTADATASIDTLMTINVFEPLVMIDDAGLAQPLLAKSWTVSPDNKTYTFRLIEDAKFSDGKPLTAATVKFSFDRAMAPDSVNPTKVLFSPIAAVETPDATTVILQLKKADNFLLFGLGQGDAAPQRDEREPDEQRHQPHAEQDQPHAARAHRRTSIVRRATAPTLIPATAANTRPS